MKLIITKQAPTEMDTFWQTGKLPAKEPRNINWLSRIVRRWRVCQKQAKNGKAIITWKEARDGSR